MITFVTVAPGSGPRNQHQSTLTGNGQTVPLLRLCRQLHDPPYIEAEEIGRDDSG